MTGIALKMFLVVTVPVIIGMIIRHFAKNFVDNQASLIQKISSYIIHACVRCYLY